ncbi:hypothetical protein V6N13_063669 [Hibiscus sabdariffa]|uniref:Uncharacterized protein n=1 Tax=Hibiscus sabdariffa TaxID=183260 RepID=A0ABR2R0Y3_9ROSI
MEANPLERSMELNHVPFLTLHNHSHTKKSHKLKFPVKISSNTDISNHYSMCPGSLKKDKKKRRLSLTLPREDIEEDIAAFEASSGGKRLRRRRKRGQPRSNADQRRLDRLFPDFD